MTKIIKHKVIKRMLERGIGRDPDSGYTRQKITLASGEKISVQASEWHYCIPKDNRGPYNHFEVGSNIPVPIWGHMLIDSSGDYYIYKYVPIQEIMDYIRTKGGVTHMPGYNVSQWLTTPKGRKFHVVTTGASEGDLAKVTAAVEAMTDEDEWLQKVFNQINAEGKYDIESFRLGYQLAKQQPTKPKGKFGDEQKLEKVEFDKDKALDLLTSHIIPDSFNVIYFNAIFPAISHFYNSDDAKEVATELIKRLSEFTESDFDSFLQKVEQSESALRCSFCGSMNLSRFDHESYSVTGDDDPMYNGGIVDVLQRDCNSCGETAVWIGDMPPPGWKDLEALLDYFNKYFSLPEIDTKKEGESNE